LKNTLTGMTILIVAAATTAAILLFSLLHVTGDSTELRGGLICKSGNTITGTNPSKCFSGCPTDTDLNWQPRRPIITTAAIHSGIQVGGEKEEEGGDKKTGEDDKQENPDGLDRLWDACKCG
jgi:hypothetical protein